MNSSIITLTVTIGKIKWHTLKKPLIYTYMTIHFFDKWLKQLDIYPRIFFSKFFSKIYSLFQGYAVIFTWHFLAQFSVYLVTSAQVLAVKAIDEGVAMVTLCNASAIWFVIYLVSEHTKKCY